ncbi:MAG: hypothetical protein F6K23_07960 [Okeania sp. SIO2C9]|uniref:hypothetical protein n=1 Tax=Okeania sp. SIO2C9 TaxID=2607791 RepID=UPI0013C162CA|nr:hypothetical protein [Okeania sp. SIO2C9]NEQ73015.1 hypothetical protein [Okeania sp. SIO2C9]
MWRRIKFGSSVDVANAQNFVALSAPSSDVLGTLGVFKNANLLLIDPNGIIFRPDPQL